MSKIRYTKYENGKVVYDNPMNDNDGSITGKCVLNLHAYFDENPEEWKRLGFTKVISYLDEARDKYDPQTQFIEMAQRRIDEYTIEEVYNIFDKSEEMLLFEELSSSAGTGFSLFSPFSTIHVET